MRSNTQYVNYMLAAMKQECEKLGTTRLTSKDIRRRIDLGGLYTLIEHGYLTDGGYDDDGQLTYILHENGKRNGS